MNVATAAPLLEVEDLRVRFTTPTLDLTAARKHRAAFGFFRDRRPELYGRLTEDI